MRKKRKNAIQVLLSGNSNEEERGESSPKKKLPDVAREFGVTHGAVSHWVKAYREAGLFPKTVEGV